MPLQLVSPQPDKHPEELSVARAALRDHLARERALRDRLHDLGEVHRRAVKASAAEEDARGALMALDIIERAAIDQWALAPVGPLPEPQTAHRAALEREITETAALARAAQAACESVAPAMSEVAAQHRALAEQRPVLIGAVLVEHAAGLQSRHSEALKVVGDLRAGLEGARVSLLRLGRGNESNAIAAALNGLRAEHGDIALLIPADEREARHQGRVRIRASYLAFADALAGDADATLPEE